MVDCTANGVCNQGLFWRLHTSNTASHIQHSFTYPTLPALAAFSFPFPLILVIRFNRILCPTNCECLVQSGDVGRTKPFRAALLEPVGARTVVLKIHIQRSLVQITNVTAFRDLPVVDRLKAYGRLQMASMMSYAICGCCSSAVLKKFRTAFL